MCTWWYLSKSEACRWAGPFSHGKGNEKSSQTYPVITDRRPAIRYRYAMKGVSMCSRIVSRLATLFIPIFITWYRGQLFVRCRHDSAKRCTAASTGCTRLKISIHCDCLCERGVQFDPTCRRRGDVTSLCKSPIPYRNTYVRRT